MKKIFILIFLGNLIFAQNFKLPIYLKYADCPPAAINVVANKQTRKYIDKLYMVNVNNSLKIQKLAKVLEEICEKKSEVCKKVLYKNMEEVK